VNANAAITPEWGIFARVFTRADPAAVASAVADAGFSTVQLNLSSVGLPTVPDRRAWADIDLAPLTKAFAAAGVRIWGVSATVNLIHPDMERRIRERRDVLALIGQVGAATQGAPPAVTLCTGTRNRDNQWRRHPANDEPDAWRDLIDALGELLPQAEHARVALGVEPEPGNVVADATRAARLLDEMQAARGTLGIVLDPANLVQEHPVDQAERIIDHAVDLLGDDVICLHAKDITPGIAPGDGLLDYEMILDSWSALPAPVPVIVQDVTEAQAPGVRAKLGAIAERHPWRGR
jgi:sugar phosphate isomerase/epimerase